VPRLPSFARYVVAGPRWLRIGTGRAQRAHALRVQALNHLVATTPLDGLEGFAVPLPGEEDEWIDFCSGCVCLPRRVPTLASPAVQTAGAGAAAGHRAAHG
jgi:hypothetical protein